MTNKKLSNKTVKSIFGRSKILLPVIWSIACVGIGYGLHTVSKPEMNAIRGGGDVYVVTGKPVPKDIRPYQTFIAFVEPINEVNLKPQVSGTIDDVLFENGAYVKAGDALFIIDKRKYEANVQSAQADLDKANAYVVQIQNDYKRQLKLYKDKFLPKAELEVVESNLAQAKAGVSQAEANLKLAQLDLEYATVTAPISGFIGKALVTKGNYVDTNSATLARIVQTNPVRIAFSVTDKERLKKLNTGSGMTDHAFSMNMILSDGREIRYTPNKVFSDNETNTDTATISVYVEYQNENHLLLPGNVISVQVSDNTEKPAILVPQSAVLQDSNGKYVMKMNDANIAVQQYIETTEMIDNMAIIEKGLTAEDTIILAGGQKVTSGQSVKSMSAK